jgi:hypothetical protein
MSQFNITRAYSKFRSKMRNSIHATLHDYEQTTPKLARAVICFNTDQGDHGDMYAAITAALDGKAVAVEGSFRQIHSHTLPTFVGFVRSNTEVLDFDEAQKRGMRAVASNVLMDASDESTWEVRHAAGAKLLVRQGVEDLSGVLATAKVSIQRTPVLSHIVNELPPTRSFCAFVDPATTTTRYGYVVKSASDMVTILPFPTEEECEDYAALPEVNNDSEDMRGEGNVISERLLQNQAPVTVGMDNIVEMAHMNGNDSFAQIAAPAANPNGGITTGDEQVMIDYYRKVYGYSPDYFNKISEIIRGRGL